METTYTFTFVNGTTQVVPDVTQEHVTDGVLRLYRPNGWGNMTEIVAVVLANTLSWTKA